MDTLNVVLNGFGWAAIVDVALAGLVAVGLVLALPVIVLFVEVVASWFASPQPAAASGPRPAVAILVPAHNEALGIVATIEALQQQMAMSDRLLVVADNCSDATAALARTAGAEVVERFNSQLRGKAFALDFGRQHLSLCPPDVVVIVDADCRLKGSSLETLVSLVAATGRPAQARYELDPPVGIHSQYLLVAAFAFLVKSLARPIGLMRLGLPSPLLGTGMAFPWNALAKVDLASSEIVEDLVLGLDLTRAGHAPLFCPQATVSSIFPRSLEGQQTQRMRWESGHLNVVLKRLPHLLIEAISKRNYQLLAMVVDAAIPPLAFLALLLFAYTGIALLALLIFGHGASSAIALGIAVIFSACIMLAWLRVGRGVISFKAVMLAPVYVVSKLGLYRRILMGRKVEWVRSRRE
jgi:cellulose synthase/poly-beta-1,6-N-acetylglucosamine synthase-like glycosyltransferase